MRRFLTTAPMLALVALTTVACEVRSQVEVRVEEDGSGTVEVAVGLDADALGRLPDLDDDGTSDVADLVMLVRVDDLRAAGWDVDDPTAAPGAETAETTATTSGPAGSGVPTSGPAGSDAPPTEVPTSGPPASDGATTAPPPENGPADDAPAEDAPDDDELTWLRATKAFGTPDEAVAVLTEVTGPDGPLRDLALTRSTGFAETSYEFSGTLDLSGGIEAFGDAGLAQVLDGEPLGQDAAAIEQELGQPLADTFTVDLRVQLPGDVDPGTGSADGADVVWSPRLGDPAQPLEASSEQRDATVLGLAAAAAVAGALLVLLLAVRLVRRSRG